MLREERAVLAKARHKILRNKERPCYWIRRDCRDERKRQCSDDKRRGNINDGKGIVITDVKNTELHPRKEAKDYINKVREEYINGNKANCGGEGRRERPHRRTKEGRQ